MKVVCLLSITNEFGEDTSKEPIIIPILYFAFCNQLLELHMILSHYELLLVLSVRHTAAVPYSDFPLGNTI